MAAAPDKMNYQNSPIMSTGRTIPRVLLVLSKDHKMFLQAYNEFTDMDGDGRVDTGFNPAVLYSGYFDPKSCYEFTRDVTSLDNSKFYEDNYFKRTGPSIDDDDQADLDGQRTANLGSSRVKAARAVHFRTGERIGICQKPNSGGGKFSGNWLNYVTMSRMDVIRKILYGGYRRVDEAAGGASSGTPAMTVADASRSPSSKALTILESSFIPNDAHVWGTDVLSDNRWELETPLTNYYDVSKYTPFARPVKNSAHMFARTRNLGHPNRDPAKPDNDYTVKPFPQVAFLLNVEGIDFIKGFNYTNKRDCKADDPDDCVGGRWYDWVMGDEHDSPSYVIKVLRDWSDPTQGSGYRYMFFNVMVEVCAPGYGEGEDCRGYPDGSLKPVGLLQKNGDNDQMLFGLLTGTYEGDYYTFASDGSRQYNRTENHRRRGGVMRTHIGEFAQSVNSVTGQIVPGGLVSYIDSLAITGARLPDNGTTAFGYITASNWGNPTGEMLYEAVRYFAFLAQDGDEIPTGPAPEYVPEREDDYSKQLSRSFPTSFMSGWGKIPTLPAADCAKPIILLLADMESDFDGDTFPAGKSGFRQKVLSSISPSAKTALSTFSVDGYLARITENEGLATSVSGKKYFYSTGVADDCKPKSLDSLAEVKGLCPSSPSLMGTYSAAAVAYYAHTHDYTPGEHEAPLDVYAVTMSAPFPQVDFPVYSSTGEVLRKISILPASMSDRDSLDTTKGIVGFLGYYIIEWRLDQNGTPYHVKFKVNFEDATQGVDYQAGPTDWDMDVVVEYTVDLVTTGATSADKRRAEPFNPPADKWSGALKVYQGNKTYHLFRVDPAARFVIDLSEIEGLVVASWKSVAAAGVNLSMGYLISGSTHDGTYMDLGHLGPDPRYFPYCDALGYCSGFDDSSPMKPYGTPAGCDWPAGFGSPTARGSGCGTRFGTNNKGSLDGEPFGAYEPELLKVYRTFQFNSDPASAGAYLPNPLYLVAKYGGFNDFNGNGKPDPGEWERTDGLPKNYFEAKNIAELPAQLEAAFQDIARSISTGTATSAAIDRILGGGVSVQTIYYPLYVNPADSSQQARWVGTVFGLFLDKWGNLREDNDHDGVLNVRNGEEGREGDFVVTFNSTKYEIDEPSSRCYAYGAFISRCYDPDGTNQLLTLFSGPERHPASLHRIEPLFDTGRWLSRLDQGKLLSGPRAPGAAATQSLGRRRIFYGKPVPRDPAKPELKVFDLSAESVAALTPFLLHDNYRSQIPSAADKNEAATMLIKWITGADQPGLRSRSVGDPWSDDRTLVTWRLGDVINSKPILVGSPAANYDLLYGDLSYLAYKEERSERRQMTYFGANDGMLHAVNVGFYGSLSSGQVSFTQADPRVSESSPPHRTEHELGAELWAYIPTSLLPHLQWLPDPDYNHANYVDLKPVINDVKINGEWRTVLIGGLRMAGRPIEAPDALALGAEFFYSEIFVLDISDPEEDPKLLWRYSDPKAGLTVGLPSVIAHDGDWYVVVPSGPATDKTASAAGGRPARVEFGSKSPYEGYSAQRARLIVLEMDSGGEITFESPVSDYLTVAEENSFFNNPFLPMAQTQANPWTNHALYYGLTVSQDPLTCEDSGAVYRLKTVDGNGAPAPPSQWTLERLIATGRPVTGAVNMTYDKAGNLWALFGTGRLWNNDDIVPCLNMNTSACRDNHQQYLYGVKEELNEQGRMTFSDRTPDLGKLVDVTGVAVFANGTVTGLPPHAEIQGLQDGTTSYNELADAIRGNASIGYKRRLDIGYVFTPSEPHNYEMIITQPKVFSSGPFNLMAFTSYEPKESGCGEVGKGYLYMVDTFTGLPNPRTAEYFHSGADAPDSSLPEGQVTGVISTGDGNPTEAFVIASASGITVSASAPDASTFSIFLPANDELSGGLTSWREVLNAGFEMRPEAMSEGLD
jgi:type IV pilus assembly protein PilY1